MNYYNKITHMLLSGEKKSLGDWMLFSFSLTHLLLKNYSEIF
jgi:hypothetical protein